MSDTEKVELFEKDESLEAFSKAMGNWIDPKNAEEVDAREKELLAEVAVNDNGQFCLRGWVVEPRDKGAYAIVDPCGNDDLVIEEAEVEGGEDSLKEMLVYCVSFTMEQEDVECIVDADFNVVKGTEPE